MLSDLQQSLKSDLDRIRRYCMATRQTIAAAESVTSGCLQLMLSTAPMAQQFFQGGIAVYNCAQKATHLNIEPIFAEKCHAVHPAIAQEMAENVCVLFRAQIGLGITGYATLLPEEGINRLYAYYAIVGRGSVLANGEIEAIIEGIDAQWHYAAQLVSILAQTLDSV